MNYCNSCDAIILFELLCFYLQGLEQQPDNDVVQLHIRQPDQVINTVSMHSKFYCVRSFGSGMLQFKREIHEKKTPGEVS